MPLHPLLHRLLIFLLQALSCTIRWLSKHQLCHMTPLKRNTKLLRDLLIRQWVIMLQIRSQPLSFQRNPESVLVHGASVVGPLREFIGVEWEFRLEAFDDFAVFVEEDLQQYESAMFRTW